VVQRLQDHGFDAFIVGGGVRDLLLGKLPKDFDVATNATPEEVKSVFPRSRLIGRRFRLAHVRKGGSLIEVATFRGDHRESGQGAASTEGRILRDNVWGTIEEDAERRDFTINAMFLDPVSGDILDFVGGYRDLADRKLRLIGDAAVRYREDPVRLLRAARFIAKLGVEPHADTGDLIGQLAPSLTDVPPARLFEEVVKLFLTGHGMRSLEALQRFRLASTLFPAVPTGRREGNIRTSSLLIEALKNTDSRVAKELPVTPAFFFAALLWEPMNECARQYESDGELPYVAVNQAAEDVFAMQARTTAVPRRFSAVTRLIWLGQLRLAKTRGKRWKRMLHERYFRAAYDFLLLRANEDPDLQPLVEFWKEAQVGFDFSSVRQAERGRRSRRVGQDGSADRPRRRRRKPRGRGKSATG
jgi:poly(A) polymerase